ncbi:sensor histidine kinase [Salinibacter grassmerensis]|uniref:sensor histidine kinase n=1 Tax=Salinibacter grassmerensis TaxID=3040353 RepID=UPI0021E7A0AD|nr:histidine kinase [Salinibacter grassmerensis]
MSSVPSSTDLDASLEDIDTQAPPKPHITWTGIGLAAVGWTLYALLYTFFIAQQEPNAPFVGLLAGQIAFVLILGLYSVPVWWVTVREMDRTGWGWVLGAHLTLGPLYAWGGLESYLFVVRAVFAPSIAAEIGAQYQWVLFGNLTVYAIQFALYHLVRNVQRLRQKERQTTELLAMAREQQVAALKAQVNPHFLFNTLNSISATLRRDPEQARNMIAKLSGMMRYALEGPDREFVPLREEIAFTRRYLDLERHRFSDRLRARMDVDADTDALDTPVPPMVLQPLVENALRHGIAPSEEGGSVTVEVTAENDELDVHVADTGVGPDAEDPLSGSTDGTGLATTTARLEHTYGPDAALRTAQNNPTGFRVWFSIPRNGTTDS